MAWVSFQHLLVVCFRVCLAHLYSLILHFASLPCSFYLLLKPKDSQTRNLLNFSKLSEYSQSLREWRKRAQEARMQWGKSPRTQMNTVPDWNQPKQGRVRLATAARTRRSVQLDKRQLKILILQKSGQR